MEFFSLNKNDIEKITDFDEIITVVEQSFADYCSRKAVIPPVTNLDIPEKHGEVHIKSSYISGYPDYCIKIASGFYKNSVIGLPAGYGMMLVYSSDTGFLNAIIFDEGLLTDLRTGAAGAVAARYLAGNDLETAGIIGTGVQGRFQIRFLERVRNFNRVLFWDVNSSSMEKYKNEMSRLMPDKEFLACSSPEEVVRNSDILITATPSRNPIVDAGWIKKGLHITAMGSDGQEKREIGNGIPCMCDKVVTDSSAQCSRLGELHHAIENGGFKAEKIYAELGELVLKNKPGRNSGDEITFCDLTGVAVQDLAVSAWALNKAKKNNLGKIIRLD